MKKSLKKIFQIVRYDFKRLMLNPITLVGLSVVLLISFVSGLVYKIPTQPVYEATVKGTTTRSIYTNFSTSSDASFDNKTNLTLILDEAQNLIDIQTNPDLEKQELQMIESDCRYRAIRYEVEKYHDLGTSKYITSGDFSEFTDIANRLHDFQTSYKSLKVFESRLIMSVSQIDALDKVANTFYKIAHSGESISSMLRSLYKNIKLFDDLQNVASSVKDLSIHADILQSLKTNYIEKANTKLSKIENEMQSLYNSTTPQDTSKVTEMKNFITNYKKVCESARDGILNELYITLYDVPNHKLLYNYNLSDKQAVQQEVVECKFYLNNNDTSFKQYQTPLNFGSASTKVTPYDHSNMIISIVGFMNVVFGIFCAYKLFGKDRKTGKLDLLLAQKVKFSEVFAAKFLAIFLCTGAILLGFTLLSLIWGSILYTFMPNSIFAVFNLQNPYTVHPFLFLLMKAIGIQLQIVFWVVITIFLMNISRKFLLNFGIAVGLMLLSTVGNIFLNGQLWYCLLPFIHTDLTSYLGGATMSTGLFKTSLYAYGNFFISFIYYWVVVVLVYNFTRQLFRKS